MRNGRLLHNKEGGKRAWVICCKGKVPEARIPPNRYLPYRSALPLSRLPFTGSRLGGSGSSQSLAGKRTSSPPDTAACRYDKKMIGSSYRFYRRSKGGNTCYSIAFMSGITDNPVCSSLDSLQAQLLSHRPGAGILELRPTPQACGPGSTTSTLNPPREVSKLDEQSNIEESLVSPTPARKEPKRTQTCPVPWLSISSRRTAGFLSLPARQSGPAAGQPCDIAPTLVSRHVCRQPTQHTNASPGELAAKFETGPVFRRLDTAQIRVGMPFRRRRHAVVAASLVPISPARLHGPLSNYACGAYRLPYNQPGTGKRRVDTGPASQIRAQKAGGRELCRSNLPT